MQIFKGLLGLFPIQNITKQYFMTFLSTKQAMNKKSQIFGQNHGLTSLQKIKFCKKIRSMFLWAKEVCFLLRTTPNNILWPF